MNLKQRPIKVLQFICPTGFYGAERWILTLVKNLRADEVVCDLAVTDEPGMPDLQLVKEYSSLGFQAFKVKMSHRFDFLVILRLVKLIKKEGYDVIHTHGYKSDMLGLVAARLCGVKAVSTPHGFENADDWKLRTYINTGNKFLKYFNYVAPLSEELCQDVAGFGVADTRIRYIKNGVDLEEVASQLAAVSSNSKIKEKKAKRIGFIGQMISRKNIRDLLSAFNELYKKHKNIELKLLGDGEERGSLEKYVGGLESAKAIEFLGFRDDRLEWLQSFDVFVMSSTLEGIPRCLMESMAMKVPVAAYNIPGIDQLIVNEKSGLLVPPGGISALASSWETLLFNTEYAEELAGRAYEYIHKEYSGKRMANEYKQLFLEMVG